MSLVIFAVRDVTLKAVPWLGLGVLAYFGMRSVALIAGKETTAMVDVGLRALFKGQANQWLGYILGGGGVLYGRRQNKLRKDNVEAMAEHIRTLESERDPARSPSTLTNRGEDPDHN